MKKIIVVVVSVLLCFCYAVVKAEASAFPLTENDIVNDIGTYYTGDICVVLASYDGLESWTNQDSIKFVDEVPLDGLNSTKSSIDSVDIVESFFLTKALPEGLAVTSFLIENPFDFDDDPDGDFDASQLRISIAGTVPLDFNVQGYEDDLIELTIPSDYLIDYFDDEPLTLHATYSTGKYKLTCVKYNVVFDVQGHGVAPQTQSIQKGFKAIRPDDPSESNYTFIGWYKEADCLNVFDFDEETILDNVTVYAKWEYVEPYTPPVQEPTYKIPATGIE